MGPAAHMGCPAAARFLVLSADRSLERTRLAVERAYLPALIEGEIVDWTIADVLRAAVADSGERLALVEPSATARARSWTYQELWTAVELESRRLAGLFEPGERLAIALTNRPEWVILEFAASLAGLTIVCVNPASTAGELTHILKQSRAVGLIHESAFRGVDVNALMASLIPQLLPIKLCTSIEAWAAKEWPLGVCPTAVDCYAPAMIQYTSGTTGKPKGAVLAHRAAVNTAQFASARFELKRGSVWLNWLPMYHTGGCIYSLLGAFWNRGVLVQMAAFEPDLALRLIQDERVAWMPAVPTMIYGLLDHPRRREFDLSSLEVIVMGGTPIPPDVIVRVEKELDVDFVGIFGQTEMSGSICQTLRGDSDHHRMHTVGFPFPYTEAKIEDPETQQLCARGEVGEICLRSYAVLNEYFDDPAATHAAKSDDGWLRTGDLGVMEEDGYLRIVGRLRDMIIRGGENIYPREIEDALAAHPSVADAAVFGVPDSKWGEVVVAAVRMRDGAGALDDEALREFLRGRIARHKVPLHIWFVDALPLATQGKVQKFALRDAFLRQRTAN